MKYFLSVVSFFAANALATDHSSESRATGAPVQTTYSLQIADIRISVSHNLDQTIPRWRWLSVVNAVTGAKNLVRSSAQRAATAMVVGHSLISPVFPARSALPAWFSETVAWPASFALVSASASASVASGPLNLPERASEQSPDQAAQQQTAEQQAGALAPTEGPEQTPPESTVVVVAPAAVQRGAAIFQEAEVLARFHSVYDVRHHFAGRVPAARQIVLEAFGVGQYRALPLVSPSCEIPHVLVIAGNNDIAASFLNLLAGYVRDLDAEAAGSLSATVTPAQMVQVRDRHLVVAIPDDLAARIQVITVNSPPGHWHERIDLEFTLEHGKKLWVTTTRVHRIAADYGNSLREPGQMQTPWILRALTGVALQAVWQIQTPEIYRKHNEQTRWQGASNRHDMNNTPSFESLWDSRSSFFTMGPQQANTLVLGASGQQNIEAFGYTVILYRNRSTLDAWLKKLDACGGFSFNVVD